MYLRYKLIRAKLLMLACCMVLMLVMKPLDAFAADCNAPSGHEGDVRYDTTDKNFYYCNSSVWVYFGGENPPSFNMPSDIKATDIASNGNFYALKPTAVNGFHAINLWAQDNGCAGYKVCTPRDIMAYMRAGNEIPPVIKGADASAWLNSSSMAQDDHAYIHTNCQRDTNPNGKWDAWSTASASYSGMMITVYDAIPPTSQLIQSRTACSGVLRVMCCKY